MINNENHKLAKEKINFLGKVLFYEDPKKAVLKAITFSISFAFLGVLFLFLEMNVVAIFFGFLSVLFLTKLTEKFIEWFFKER